MENKNKLVEKVIAKRVTPKFIKLFAVKPYLRNKPRPHYNVRTKPRGLDY